METYFVFSERCVDVISATYPVSTPASTKYFSFIEKSLLDTNFLDLKIPISFEVTWKRSCSCGKRSRGRFFSGKRKGVKRRKLEKEGREKGDKPGKVLLYEGGKRKGVKRRKLEEGGERKGKGRHQIGYSAARKRGDFEAWCDFCSFSKPDLHLNHLFLVNS